MTKAAVSGKALAGAQLARQVYLLVENGLGWADIPADLRGCVWLERYAADVANGGHSQFFANTNTALPEGAIKALDWVIDGARFVGTDPLAQLASQARAWAVAHPAEARDQTGTTGGRAAALDPLDAQYLKADRGDTDAFRSALAQVPDNLAERLGHTIGLGTPVMRHTPLHTVGLQMALIGHTPKKIVTQKEFEASVLSQIKGSGTAASGLRRKALRQITSRLPGEWYCAGLLALNSAGQHPPVIEVWGDDRMASTRPRDDKGILPIIGSHPREVLIQNDTVVVQGAPRTSFLPEPLPPPAVKGIFARLRQKQQMARFNAFKAEKERAARAAAPPDLSCSLQSGKVLRKALLDMQLGAALLLLTEEHNLPKISRIQLRRADLGVAPRIEWQFWFGTDEAPVSAHVIQTGKAVTMRLDDADVVTRFTRDALKSAVAAL